MKTPLLSTLCIVIHALLLTGCGDDGAATTDVGSTGAAATTDVATGPGSGTTGPGSTTESESTTGSEGTTGSESTAGPADTSTGGVELTPFEQAVDAIGGEDALTDLALLQIDSTGERYIDYEQSQPGATAELSSYVTSSMFDFENDGLRVDTEKTPLFEALQFFPPENYGVVLNGDVGGLDAQAGFIPPGDLASQVVGAVRTQHRLLNPHVYLREGLADPGLVGDGGAAEFDGRPHRIITFEGQVSEVRLFVDDDTGFISKLETNENNVLARDVPIEVRYDGWQSEGSLAFPGGVELYSEGALIVDETRTAVQIEPDLPADTFDLPPETIDPMVDPEAFAFGRQSHNTVEAFFIFGTAYAEQPGFMPTQLAPGITLLGSSANSVVIEHDGGLAVLEGPQTPAHGTAIVEFLGMNFPGSALTHVIQSHHHQDHAAGVRSFVAEGATLVVGSGVSTFWDDILSADSTIRPDALSAVDVVPDVQEIDEDGAFVLDGGTVTVTAHHVSANTHSDDMVVTVIDAGGERFVYVADLYNTGTGFTVVIGGPAEFFDILRDLDIIDASCASPVPLTIIGAHGIPVSLAESLAELEGLGVDVGC